MKKKWQDPATRNIFGNIQEVNDIFQQAVNDIVLKKTENKNEESSVKMIVESTKKICIG